MMRSDKKQWGIEEGGYTRIVEPKRWRPSWLDLFIGVWLILQAFTWMLGTPPEITFAYWMQDALIYAGLYDPWNF